MDMRLFETVCALSVLEKTKRCDNGDYYLWRSVSDLLALTALIAYGDSLGSTEMHKCSSKNVTI